VVLDPGLYKAAVTGMQQAFKTFQLINVFAKGWVSAP
jgi:hypothetical protein